MELNRRSGPLPDPFFEVLRRRHPDVDLVILPAEAAPVAPTGPPADRAFVESERTRAEALVAALWRVVPDSPEIPPAAGFAPGSAAGTVRPRVEHGRQDPDGFRMLVRLKDELADRGWRVDRVAGPVERVVAEGEEARVVASFAPGHDVFRFVLVLPDVYVGAERARDLAGVA